ncbi:hypothetical protein GGS23DRAFT_595295 [Durotheca rogersii]|uniref:uncharacterized protein n=1 Tax=Durotheca rogersii TaxID=419775 RepID=UPI0022207DD4|nr:uncharacterized protein GGS23DRAFT_595295 [Durotheca rogersii]KAI5864574.1 hypothetical protein GGS23DRAFT_595295 [Durotheca rogersii]
MSGTVDSPSRLPSNRPRADDVRDDEAPSASELMEIARKSLMTGAMTGAIGTMVGAGAGIMRSAPPTLFALFAGFQWFTLGSTYIASRSLLRSALGGEENLSPSGLVTTSGVAGSISGTVGGMFRGPRNIIPGMLVFGIAGTGGSYIAQRFQSRLTNDRPEPTSSWLDSKWNPLRRLSDEEYKEMLEAKILAIDADISIIDDNIAALRASQSSSSSSSMSSPPEGSNTTNEK